MYIGANMKRLENPDEMLIFQKKCHGWNVFFPDKSVEYQEQGRSQLLEIGNILICWTKLVKINPMLKIPVADICIT